MSIVPARGGSKGIHRKNLRKIAGKSLVKLAGEYCKKFDFIDLDNLVTKKDFLKARATSDSVALKRKFSKKKWHI